MKYRDFTMRADGFAGHLVEPDGGSDRAVVIAMGGESGLLPARKIAERFADYGIAGLAVTLFGAEGLPAGVDRIPVDMFVPAVRYLREEIRIPHLSLYGMSMGSIFAAAAAARVGGVENLILVTPTHVPFEGSPDKKAMSGHSVATWHGVELPYVKPDFTARKSARYYYDAGAGRKVTGMWLAYRDAYRDKALEQAAALPVEESGARILMLAGAKDEAWPSDYSVARLEARLNECAYPLEHRVILFPDAGHLIGMMPSREREPRLYRMLPLIGLMYRSFAQNRKACMEALSDSEREIVAWVSGETRS